MTMQAFLSFFLSLLVRSYMSITPGSANLEILIKLEDQKVLKRSPDLLDNVKIGQSQLII